MHVALLEEISWFYLILGKKHMSFAHDPASQNCTKHMIQGNSLIVFLTLYELEMQLWQVYVTLSFNDVANCSYWHYFSWNRKYYILLPISANFHTRHTKNNKIMEKLKIFNLNYEISNYKFNWHYHIVKMDITDQWKEHWNMYLPGDEIWKDRDVDGGKTSGAKQVLKMMI